MKQPTLSGGIWQNPESPQYSIQNLQQIIQNYLIYKETVTHDQNSEEKVINEAQLGDETDTEFVREGFLIQLL